MVDTSATSFELADYACFRVVGNDAEAFLQGQLSNDIRQLATDGSQLSTYNDPQGRVLALIRLFHTADGIVAALPASLFDTVTRRLQMFLLRSHARIEACPEWRLVGRVGDLPAVRSGPPPLALPGGASLCVTLEAGQPPAKAGSARQWATLETRHGMPEVYPETSGHFVAQMLWLDRLGAISFTKGCYVGQEVIARAHHLGRVKRHARLFRLSHGPVCPGDPVTREGTKSGEVARIAGGDGDTLVLAVLRDDITGNLQVAGAPLEPMPDPPAYGATDS